MKKEIIYSSGNYLRDEFKIEGYLFGKQSEGSERTGEQWCDRWR